MFGSNTLQGRRKYQQDALVVGEEVASGYRLFGIYDGHGANGGGRCSKLAATVLTDMIRKRITDSINAHETSSENLGNVLIEAFKEFDHHLTTLPRKEEKKQRKNSWSSMFSTAKSQDFDESGSCACVVLSTPEGFVVANLGDSRAIMSDGKRITTDHTALSVPELERIYSQKGWAANGRVFGILSPSRAFGDFKLKSPDLTLLPVSHIPEITVIPRTEGMARYIVIMCDGIHNVLKDYELAKFCQTNAKLHPADLAECITGEAFKRFSRDNLSCIVIRTEATGSSLSLPVAVPRTVCYNSSAEEKSSEEKSDGEISESEESNN